MPHHPRHPPWSAFLTCALLGLSAVVHAEIILIDETNALIAAHQVEADADTSENQDVTTSLAVGQRLTYTESGSNDYGCCGGRDGNYGAHNLNDDDIGEGVPSDGTFALPTSGEAMVDITLDAGRVPIGGIAIYNGYGNRDDGDYTLRDGAGNLIASWTISNTLGATNAGVDSFYLQFKTPVLTDRLIIDGVVGDCCQTASFREIQVFGVTIDSDGDGMPDAYEIANGLNPAVNDADGDLDGDGLSNLVESQRGTAANRVDTDEDGLSDRVETNTGTYVSTADTGTHPLKPDTDEDGLLDGVETRTGVYISPSDTGTDPFVVDSDADGFSDGVEVSAGFDPNLASNTPAGSSTIRVAIEFLFFGVPEISYRIEGSVDLENWSVLEPVVIGDGTRLSRFYSTENQPSRFFRAVPN